MKGGVGCGGQPLKNKDTCGTPGLKGGKKAPKKASKSKKNNLAEYNKKLNAAIEKNSKDKKIKNMKDVRAEAKKGFDKISAEDRKGRGVALKLYNKEVDKVLMEKVGVKNRKELHALIKK